MSIELTIWVLSSSAACILLLLMMQQQQTRLTEALRSFVRSQRDAARQRAVAAKPGAGAGKKRSATPAAIPQVAGEELPTKPASPVEAASISQNS